MHEIPIGRQTVGSKVDRVASMAMAVILNEKERFLALERRPIADALDIFGDAHPDVIASFLRPYNQDGYGHHDMHIVIPHDLKYTNGKSSRLIGFDQQSARFFAVLIPKKDIQQFFKDSADSRKFRHSRAQQYYNMNREYAFEEVSRDLFIEAFRREVVHKVQLLSPSKPVFDALEKYPPLEPVNLENFFGPEKSGPQNYTGLYSGA